jgi:3-hydroxyisobutyrate dehydrogenase-like beta-hydroxyacid dehydrogenase
VKGSPVGFVGLGNMGSGMANRLMDAGFDLVVRDVQEEAVRAAVARGATAAATAAELAWRSDLVHVAVFDESQVRGVCFGREDDDGLFAVMRPGGVVVVHSTIAPDAIREIAAAGAARSVSVLDSPMTGAGEQGARDGTLRFYVGGEAAALERCRPTLEAMSSAIFHVGSVGDGVTTKIVVNAVAIANVKVVREAVEVAGRLGIGPERLVPILDATVAASWASANWDTVQTLVDTYSRGRVGRLEMIVKDLTLAERLSGVTGAATPMLACLADDFRSALADELRHPATAS